MKYNIYCPLCLERDGLNVALDNLHCPQCSNEFVFFSNGLEVAGNGTFDFSICKLCGGRFVHHSFMVSDGHDDVDWDFDDWCENSKCPSNNPSYVETNTEFGIVKIDDDKKESIIL